MNATSVPPARGALLGLFSGAIIIGFAPIFVRLSETGPTATAFWRMALALPGLLAWALVTRRQPPDTPATIRPAGVSHWKLLAAAGAFFAGDLAVWHLAIHFTTVANATLEANLSAVFVPLMAWLLFRQRVSRRFLVALAVAFSGTILLIGKNAHLSPQTLRGDTLGICTGLFYAAYILAVKAARNRGVGTARIMAASGVVSAAVLLPLALLSGERLFPATPQGWWPLAGLALFSHLAGQSLIAYALARLPASFASVGLLVQPATATLVAWVWLGESLSWGQFSGALILLAGLWLARDGLKAESPPLRKAP